MVVYPSRDSAVISARLWSVRHDGQKLHCFYCSGPEQRVHLLLYCYYCQCCPVPRDYGLVYRMPAVTCGACVECLHGVALHITWLTYVFPLTLRRVVSVYAPLHRASWWFNMLGHLLASGVLRYKNQQHGIVCRHRCDPRTWCWTPSGVNWRCTSSSVTYAEHWAIYCQRTLLGLSSGSTAPSTTVKLNWIELTLGWYTGGTEMGCYKFPCNYQLSDWMTCLF